MSRMKSVVVALLAVSASASFAGAQFPGMGGSTRPISLVVSGGLTLPAGDLGDFHDAGFHYDASLLINIPGFPLTLRPEFSLTRFKWEGIAPGGSVIDGSTQMIGALGNIEVPLGAGLYVLGGGGILSLSRESDVSTEGDVSATEFTFDAGAGFRFALGGARGFVEARIGAASYDQGKVGFSKAQFIPVTFGLVF
jgi:hypothetical protein